jgi:hypothetical protein
MRYTLSSCTPLPCTLSPCTALSTAGLTLTSALPHRRSLRGRPRQVTAVRDLVALRAGRSRAAMPHLHPRTPEPCAFLAVSHLAYTAHVPQPQLHSHARASTASLEPAPALPHQSSSARAPPRRELRFSAAWPAYRSRVCATPPARATSIPAPTAARYLLPHALQRLPKPSRRTQHLLTRSSPPPALRSWACPSLRSARLRASHQSSRPRAPSNCRPLPLLCAARLRALALAQPLGPPATQAHAEPPPLAWSRLLPRAPHLRAREPAPPSSCRPLGLTRAAPAPACGGEREEGEELGSRPEREKGVGRG